MYKIEPLRSTSGGTEMTPPMVYPNKTLGVKRKYGWI